MIVLEELTTEFGHIRITQSKRDGVRTYYQGRCFHSQADANGVSTCAYIHAMYQIILQSGAQSVLLIGGAGGTLATMLRHDGCEVTVVDINPHAFDIARRFFHMQEDVECIVADGAAYVENTDRRFDAIALDAFNVDGEVPEPFLSEAFCRSAKRSLTPGGVFVMNVMVGHDLDLLADRAALTLESAGLPPLLFDWPGRHERNVLITGNITHNIRLDNRSQSPWIREDLQSVACRHPQRLAKSQKKT